jgi:uncharacterized RmlC-like cupin family protein
MAEQVQIIPGTSLETGPMTPGMSRAQAFASDAVWVGEVHTDPGSASGWHHHGEHATYGRVLSGAARVDFGPGGATTLEAGPGDFFFVPPNTVHRESNPGDDKSLLVVVRVGSGPAVVNVDGPDAG